MATYDYMTSLKNAGRKVQVESAKRDGSGKNLENNYAKQDGAYETLLSGNLISDINYEGLNDFAFGTGTNDTIDGEASILEIRGHTEWSGNTPSYANAVSHLSIVFNLWDGTNGWARVVKSDGDNNGICISVEGNYDASLVGKRMQFSTDPGFSSITNLTIASKQNTTGDTYAYVTIPADGYIRPNSADFEAIPSKLCLSNVWGGYQVHRYIDWDSSENRVLTTLDTSSYFSDGMKSIEIDGDQLAYDSILTEYSNTQSAKIKRVEEATFPAANDMTLTFVAAAGTKNIYSLSRSGAIAGGALKIGGDSAYAWQAEDLTASSVLTGDAMCCVANAVKFTVDQSNDTSYGVADPQPTSETFSSGTYFVSDGTSYTQATEFDQEVADANGYYVADTHGQGGAAIKSAIGGKKYNYQISPAVTAFAKLDWSYLCGDFGTEQLNLLSGYPAVPFWLVSYPLNIKETVQELPKNYVSLESAEKMLHQVGDAQGFTFDHIEATEEGEMVIYKDKNGQQPGVTVTKETIGRTEFSATIPWTQYVDMDDTINTDIKKGLVVKGISFTYDSEFKEIIISGTADGLVDQRLSFVSKRINIPTGHKFAIKAYNVASRGIYIDVTYYNDDGVTQSTLYGCRQGVIYTMPKVCSHMNIWCMISDGQTINERTTVNIFDLTDVYGPGKEPDNWEEFNEDFPLPYYGPNKHIR